MSQVPEFVVVLTTVGTEADAVRLARALVEEQLAACVNILPAMTSVYRWQGRIEQEPEHQLVIKTRSVRLSALEARLRELHPYQVPELLVLPVERGGEDYLKWIGENIVSSPTPAPGPPADPPHPPRPPRSGPGRP